MDYILFNIFDMNGKLLCNNKTNSDCYLRLSKGYVLLSNSTLKKFEMTLNSDLDNIFKLDCNMRMEFIHAMQSNMSWVGVVTQNDDYHIVKKEVHTNIFHNSKKKKCIILMCFQKLHRPNNNILESIFPRHVIENIENNKMNNIRTYHENVTIMFADIVGFTEMCRELSPNCVMDILDNLYSKFDDLATIYNVYKLETVGDCYIIIGGLMYRDSDGYISVRSEGVDAFHAISALRFSQAILEESRKLINPVTKSPIQIRVGLHSGPVVSGIVGYKMPRFCLFGDSMNIAQRMESTSYPGCINISTTTLKALPVDNEIWKDTCNIAIKGIGNLKTYLWTPKLSLQLTKKSISSQLAKLKISVNRRISFEYKGYKLNTRSKSI